MSGVLAMNGEMDGPPVRLSLPVGDLNGGLLAVIGILASLAGRSKGQKGRFVDISLQDGLVSALGYMATHHDVSGEKSERSGSRHSSIVPYGTFTTKNGWIALAIFTTPFWRKFCAAVGREDLATDSRFSNTAGRMENRRTLEPIVDSIIVKRTTEEWDRLLEQCNVPASAILSIPEVLEHEHTHARGMFPSISHSAYGAVRVPGPPIRLGGHQVEQPLPPPLLGEHTREVLGDLLKLDGAEINRLEDDGIIGRASSSQQKNGGSR